VASSETLFRHLLQKKAVKNYEKPHAWYPASGPRFQPRTSWLRWRVAI